MNTLAATVMNRYLSASAHFEFTGAIMVSAPIIESIQREGEKAMRELIGDEADEYIRARQQRDGSKAHMTVVGPPEARKVLDFLADEALKADPSLSKGKAKDAAKTKLKELMASWDLGSLRSKGLGRVEAGGKEAYFMVVDWPKGRDLRKDLGIDPDGQDFHVTVGFKGGDVHGVRKNRPL